VNRPESPLDATLRGVKGALLDVDGTLMSADRAIGGAAEALARLRARGLALRLTTNTTRRPRRLIASVLGAAGIEAATREVIIPASLACRRIVESGRRRAVLLVPEASKEDFDGVDQVRDDPDWIVFGDLGRSLTLDHLDEAFRWLRQGAGFLALHKNPWWNAGGSGDKGIVLDAGSFVAALEYASGVTAEVVGKPSPAFFELALSDIGLSASEVVCVGDNLENDCVGASRAGCRTILLRTGVFDAGALARSDIQPDLVLDSIAALG